METMQTQSTGNKKGASVAIVIIILIIALGGAYFWYTRTSTMKAPAVDMKTKPAVSALSLQNELNTVGNVDISADMKGLDQVYK